MYASKIYFRCKPIYNSVTQKQLPSYRSKVYIRDNSSCAITYNKQSTKDREQNKTIGKSWIITIFEHMIKQHTTFSEKKYLILKLNIQHGLTWFKENKMLHSVKIGATYIWKSSTWLEKGDSTFSKNWCYNSKHNMVKKTRFYLQLNNIFLNPAWLKYKILLSVKTGAIFQSSKWLKKQDTTFCKNSCFFNTKHG